MKQIDAFVESVYQNVRGSEKEIIELKAEMKNHLLETVQDLLNEGKSEQEAVTIAIERFGGENEVRSVVNQLFKVQKIFAKRLLYIAIGVLVITVIIFSSYWVKAQSNANELSIIRTAINDVMENEESITLEMEKEIEKLVESTDHISEVSIYDSKDIRTEGKNFIHFNTELKSPDYQYERTLW
ncbi:permease prefix domain 1-containing protein [Bacillus sp. Marseille-Q3570]|uniref:permease prefix domain 1-containing protein n=1 Tax=Bacillus sp. Marseille-Q3570 TaxID=2963522 RepID=UPI0021B70B1E|nr:permease prefix domain 1-containing protein [Bacillus sp. Marseille-Q3570]